MLYPLIIGDAVMILLFILKFPHLPPQIPLFYSRSGTGEDQLGDLWMIFFLPFFLHLFYFLNGFIYKKIFNGNLFVKKILDYFNLGMIIIVTLIVIKILFIIG